RGRVQRGRVPPHRSPAGGAGRGGVHAGGAGRRRHLAGGGDPRQRAWHLHAAQRRHRGAGDPATVPRTRAGGERDQRGDRPLPGWGRRDRSGLGGADVRAPHAAADHGDHQGGPGVRAGRGARAAAVGAGGGDLQLVRLRRSQRVAGVPAGLILRRHSSGLILRRRRSRSSRSVGGFHRRLSCPQPRPVRVARPAVASQAVSESTHLPDETTMPDETRGSAMYDTHVTVVGNVLHEPQWRRTANTGALVATFKIASTARRRNRETGPWVDGNSLRVRVTCWRALASNVKHSVTRGDPVIVTGRLFTRDWRDSEGVVRTQYELEAAAVGHDLSRGRAVFERVRPHTSTSAVEDAQAQERVGGEPTEPVPDDEAPSRFHDVPYEVAAHAAETGAELA